MGAEQRYGFKSIADILITIKNSIPPDAFSFIVEIYNKEVQDIKKRGGYWGDADFTSHDIDEAIGYLFDKMEMFGWRLWRCETTFGVDVFGNRIKIYLTK